MLYVISGHKKDMYFVCQDMNGDGILEIVRVFYSEINAEQYIKDSVNREVVYDG